MAEGVGRNVPICTVMCRDGIRPGTIQDSVSAAVIATVASTLLLTACQASGRAAQSASTVFFSSLAAVGCGAAAGVLVAPIASKRWRGSLLLLPAVVVPTVVSSWKVYDWWITTIIYVGALTMGMLSIGWCFRPMYAYPKCRRCGYILYGNQFTCPECGYRIKEYNLPSAVWRYMCVFRDEMRIRFWVGAVYACVLGTSFIWIITTQYKASLGDVDAFISERKYYGLTANEIGKVLKTTPLLTPDRTMAYYHLPHLDTSWFGQFMVEVEFVDDRAVLADKLID